MESKIKPSYEGLNEICGRLGCGADRVRRLIQEGLPAIKIARSYYMTERAYLDWIDGEAKKEQQK